MLSALRSALRMTTSTSTRLIQSSAVRPIEYKEKSYRRVPADDEGAQGEKLIGLDTLLKL